MSWTACQSRPPSLGSKCLSRIVFQITSNASTFLARRLSVSVSGTDDKFGLATFAGSGSWAYVAAQNVALNNMTKPASRVARRRECA